MKEENTFELSTKQILGICLIALCVIALLVGCLKYEDKKVEKEINQIKKEIELTLKSEDYHLDDPDTPYHYIVNYKVNKDSRLLKDDIIYTYEIIKVRSKDEAFQEILFLNQAYKKISNKEIYGYVSYENAKELEGVNVVGKGLSEEDIQRKHPNAVVIGKNISKTGKWIVKSENKLNYDVVEELYDSFYNSEPFAKEED